MADMTFYKQVRADGGIRTGLEIDGETVLGRYHGDVESDPVLVWYVDIRCRRGDLPADAEGARQWLLKNADAIQTGLRALADELETGLDIGPWPLIRELPTAPSDPGFFTIVCMAIRRGEGLHLGDELRQLADHWQEHIAELGALESLRA